MRKLIFNSLLLLSVGLFVSGPGSLYAQTTEAAEPAELTPDNVTLPDIEAPRIALVTFGPGPQLWARFGHNAIRVTWPAESLHGAYDVLYNFGYFDLDEPGFYQNYALGKMQYYAQPGDPASAFQFYQRINRSIREQTLKLQPEQAVAVADRLDQMIQPESRQYAYDYFYNNCSTRVRDVLDSALGGTLQQSFADQPAAHTLRWDALRMVQDDLLLYLGLHIGLGRMVDQPVSRYDAAFLPGNLARQFSVINPTVISNDQQIYSGRSAATNYTPRYLSMVLMGLGTALIMLLPLLCRARWLKLSGLRLWLLISGLAGLVLLFLWAVSDHQAAWRNENLLLLSPFNLLLLSMRNGLLSRLAGHAIPLFAVVALLLKLMPHPQFNTDLLLWLLPAQLTAYGCWLMKRKR